MKKVNYYFFCLLFTVALIAGCKKDDGGGPTPEEAALAKLQGTWVLSDVKKDNAPINGYEDMKLTITNKSIAASGTPDNSVFPTGAFTFEEGDYNTIVVDGINVRLVNITDTNLTTSFSLNEDGSNASRVAIVQGNYVFTFTKE
jgi:hypothetical protein